MVPLIVANVYYENIYVITIFPHIFKLLLFNEMFVFFYFL